VCALLNLFIQKQLSQFAKKNSEVVIGKTIGKMNKRIFCAHFLCEQRFIPLKVPMLAGTYVHLKHYGKVH
jgi:hypothetical protein